MKKGSEGSLFHEEAVDDEPSNHSARPGFDPSASVSRRKVALEAGPTIFKQASQYNNEPFVLSVNLIILPWSIGYKIWWGITVFGACLTIFTETYNIAFTQAGLTPYNDGSSILELILVGIFCIDIAVNFCLAFYDENSEIVLDHRQIARHYVRCGMFWIDIIGIFPFYALALAISGEMGEDSSLSRYLSLLRLVRFVRLHRLVLVFEILQYSAKISLMALTLIRNFTAALVWCHFNACVFYFIAREYDYNPDTTWIGGVLVDSGLDGFERYLTSLYFTIVTFTTVGYGDYSPVNSAEQIWGMIFMLINIIFASWVIGSITLLIVKADEKTGLYRDSLQTLEKFSDLHDLDKGFRRGLKSQLLLEFNNREINEEQVLERFPSSVRRKVLRKIYLPDLMRTNLLTAIRQQFLDAFLSACKIEIISADEDLLQKGSVASDLYFLVGGSVKLMPEMDVHEFQLSRSGSSERKGVATSVADSELRDRGYNIREVSEGHFINDVGFFTESPQMHTVRTKTVCNTLILSRSNYKIIAADYPDAVTQLLRNLLEKVRGAREQPSTFADEAHQHEESVQQATAVMAVEDLIQAHMHKLKDDHTTRFLFAASRGDTNIVAHMCENGFDPNESDYDMRTALMVASMKGHTDTVAKLLEYQADPNLVDMHGSSALYEAATNGHDLTVQVLLKHGAQLCLKEGQAASKLCQAVFDGDIALLRRLLEAQIEVDASDYDKRTAAHIAGAEGNLAALKMLVEFGSSALTVKDRWANSVEDEARKSDAAKLMLQYLEELKKS